MLSLNANMADDTAHIIVPTVDDLRWCVRFDQDSGTVIVGPSCFMVVLVALSGVCGASDRIRIGDII